MKEIFQKNEHSHCMCLYKQEARNQNLFLPAVKKTHHFWLFGNIVRDIIQNFFFSRILILHEKKEEKNYVKSDMTKKKKSNTQLCDKYVFVSLIRFF